MPQYRTRPSSSIIAKSGWSMRCGAISTGCAKTTQRWLKEHEPVKTIASKEPEAETTPKGYKIPPSRKAEPSSLWIRDGETRMCQVCKYLKFIEDAPTTKRRPPAS